MEQSRRVRLASIARRVLRRAARWLWQRRKGTVEAVVLASGVASAYFAWMAGDAARDAVALQSAALKLDRAARRPYFRMVRKALDAPGFDSWARFKAGRGVFPQGEAKRVSFTATNSGQRVASEILWSVAAVVDKRYAVPGILESLRCTHTIANDVAPGDTFEMSCPVYAPVHDEVSVSVGYADVEAGGELYRQVFEYDVGVGSITDARGRVNRALLPPTFGLDWVELERRNRPGR
jgi:hypothetical protein